MTCMLWNVIMIRLLQTTYYINMLYIMYKTEYILFLFSSKCFVALVLVCFVMFSIILLYLIKVDWVLLLAAALKLNVHRSLFNGSAYQLSLLVLHNVLQPLYCRPRLSTLQGLMGFHAFFVPHFPPIMSWTRIETQTERHTQTHNNAYLSSYD